MRKPPISHTSRAGGPVTVIYAPGGACPAGHPARRRYTGHAGRNTGGERATDPVDAQAAAPAPDTLRAAIDRIIPPDDFPSATAAGVDVFIARHLAGDGAALAPILAAWLEALDRESRAGDGAPFAALPPARQDSLLERVEAGAVTTAWPVPPREGFALLVTLANEGYYGDPGGGGNRDGVGWRMIGYETGLPAVPPR